MSGAFLVAAKELREGLRDRRAIFSALAATLAGPLVVGIIIGMMARERSSIAPLQVWIAGGEQAPSLLLQLRNDGMVLVDAGAGLETDVRAGRADVGLVVMRDYARDFAASKPAKLGVVSDPTRAVSREAARRLREKLSAYGRQVAALRMVARGVNPGVATPVRVEDVDVSTERSRAAVALSVLPVFLLVSAFVMGMGLATDTTAGERERRTLESLLLTGARPWAIGAGKWMAAATLNVAGFALTLAVAGAILARLPLEDLGVRLDSVLDMAAAALMVGAPLAMLAAALQLLAAARARSFKEGQTYLSMLLFVPMAVGMMLAFSRWEGASWQLGVPVLAQHQLLSAVLRGDAPGVLALAAPALIAVAVTALLLRRVAKLLSSPQILYGG